MLTSVFFMYLISVLQGSISSELEFKKKLFLKSRVFVW